MFFWGLCVLFWFEGRKEGWMDGWMDAGELDRGRVGLP